MARAATLVAATFPSVLTRRSTTEGKRGAPAVSVEPSDLSARSAFSTKRAARLNVTEYGNIIWCRSLAEAAMSFLAWIGDHSPGHVHVYRDRTLVVKWDRQLAADEGARRCATQETLEGAGGGGKIMKILGVVANNRKHAFEVRTSRQTLVFPYTKADPVPSSTDRIAEAFVDPELGREAFTYRLVSGDEGSVHIDAVLEYNEDPSYMAELTLYRLTKDARSRFEASGLSAREVSRWLNTSPTQLYRLLDPTNYSKSLRQLISLLYVLGCEVEVEVRERPSPSGGSAGSALV